MKLIKEINEIFVHTVSCVSKSILCVASHLYYDTHTDTQTHRHTDTQTHRHTDTQTHIHTYRHTDTQTHIHTSYTNRKMNRFFRVRPSVTLPVHILVPTPA